ncbi:MAG: hypothetical protein ACPG31_11875 [Planctomycetota bacterium]
MRSSRNTIKVAVAFAGISGLLIWASAKSSIPETVVESGSSAAAFSVIESPTPLERPTLDQEVPVTNNPKLGLEQNKVFVKFLDGFGKPIIGTEAIRSSWGTKEAEISLEALSSEGIWVFRYWKPKKNDPWLAKITISINLGDTDLEKEVDLGSLAGSLANPTEVRLSPKGLWDQMIASVIEDETGCPIVGAEIRLIEEMSNHGTYSLEEVVSAETGGFWLSHEEINPGTGLQILANGFQKREFYNLEKGIPQTIVLRPGKAFSGSIALPQGATGGRVVFEQGENRQVVDVQETGVFTIPGLSGKGWAASFLRNSLYFPLAENLEPGLSPFEFDLRNETRLVRLNLTGESGEEVSDPRFVIVSQEGRNIEVNMDVWSSILLPLDVDKGVVVSSNCLDLPVAISGTEIALGLESKATVRLLVSLPDWLSNQFQLERVHMLEVNPVLGGSRSIFSPVIDGESTCIVPHLGEYRFFGYFSHPEVPNRLREMELVLESGSPTASILTENMKLPIRLSPSQDWLAWAESRLRD